MSRILFVGGGTIGHIAPAIAVLDALKAQLPTIEARFICLPRQLETDFLEDANLPYDTLEAPRLSLLYPLHLRQAAVRAGELLDTWQPDVIFSKGGYVSVPVCLAAKRRRIPIILHESDAVSGRANRIVSRFATQVCAGFPDTLKNAVFTGNPVRTAVTRGSREQALAITRFQGNKPILLIMGGSQGAQSINEIILSQLDPLLATCDIIHITGQGKGNTIQAEGYYRTEFATADLPHFYAAATLALSRAGAGSLAELAANGIPTIVVPLRGVGHDHQQKNALAAAATGGCIVVQQAALPEELLPTIKEITSDTTRRNQLSANIKQLNSTDAAGRISEIISKVLAKSTKAH